MLRVLAGYGSENAKHIAIKILNEETTITREKKYAGSFMTAVYDGDFLEAYNRADKENKEALKRLLRD